MDLILTLLFFTSLRINLNLAFIVSILIIFFSIKKKMFNTIPLIGMFMIFEMLLTLDITKHLLHSLYNIFYDNFSAFISNSFTENYSIFLISITIGTASVKLPQNIYNLFKELNLLHAVSISGANFELIKNLFSPLNSYIDKKFLNLLIFIIQSLYILLIGFNNIPALRAYIFSLISTHSVVTGRPTNFVRKLLITIIIVTIFKFEEITSMSFLLSIGFSIFYKLLQVEPINRIFDSEIKKLVITFMLSVIIFNANSPDFFANLIFAILYPLIFISIFVCILLKNIHLVVLIDFVNFLVNLILTSFNNLQSPVLIYTQILIFILTFIQLFKDLFKFRDRIYEKFAQ